MKIRLINPRNKRLKNKIATYNSEDYTWTIGKSKKVYEAIFRYSFPPLISFEDLKKTSWYQKHFDCVGCMKNPQFPIEEMEKIVIG